MRITTTHTKKIYIMCVCEKERLKTEWWWNCAFLYMYVCVCVLCVYIHITGIHTYILLYICTFSFVTQILFIYIALSLQLVRFLLGTSFRKLYLLRRAVSILRFIETYPNPLDFHKYPLFFPLTLYFQYEINPIHCHYCFVYLFSHLRCF